MKGSEKAVLTPRYDSFKTHNIITDVIKHEKVIQIYKGPVVRGCYHGRGLMIWIEENQKQTYEGYFYVNQIHGYGCMTYANGMIFEGLYKENIRFGPGVMTYPDQHQAVGFWIGTCLLRLSCNLTKHTVPSYDLQNISTKIKLLQFRHLIDLTQPPYSITNIRDDYEKYLNNNYSFPYSRHLNSLFFDAQAFDSQLMISKTNTEIITESIFKEPQVTSEKNDKFSLNCNSKINNISGSKDGHSWTIQNKYNDSNSKLKDSESSGEKSKNYLDKDTLVNHCENILAYNNNTLDKMILTHAYQQQFGKSVLLYDVHNIWNGKRNMFMPSNDQELAAINLLSTLQLSLESAQNIVKNLKIDSDVADSRGNTRLIISSANDQHEMINCMVDLGANLECYNDDGFTPLNLTLMRYITMLNDIESWTEYLIPPQTGDQSIKSTNTGKINFFQLENLSNMKFGEIINDEIENNDTNFSSKHTAQRKQMAFKPIEKTITLLISLGAKVTTCFLPKTSIHLALLTANPIILQAIFNAGGSQSYIFSSDESSYTLNLLHMAVMMPTNQNIVKCVEILITQKVNPNFKTLPLFTIFRHKLPWRKITTPKDSMTPLDIFCLKENKSILNRNLEIDEKSESELVSILYDVTKKSHSYCGLKPMALAMLTGKLHLTKTLLNKNRKNVDETISGLGTLLTLLLNPTYNLNLSYKKITKLLDLLLDANSNPLKIVKISSEKFRGNIFEYCHKLSETKKLNVSLSNFGGIIEKLKSVGKFILNAAYAIKAKAALLKKVRDLSRSTYNNHRTTLADDWIKMLLWLEFGFNTTYQVKVKKDIESRSFTINRVQNNEYTNNIEDNFKVGRYDELYLIKLKPKSLTHSPINLTKEESQVCYECLKYSSIEMEPCSSCYFALFCSESCKNQHTKHGCITRIKQNQIIMQFKLDKNDLLMNNTVKNKSYLSSTYSIYSENLRLKSMINSGRITLASMSYIKRSTLSFMKQKSFLENSNNSFSRKLNTSFLRKSSASLLIKLSASLFKKSNTIVSRISNSFFEKSSNSFLKNKNSTFSRVLSTSISKKSSTLLLRRSNSASSRKSNSLSLRKSNSQSSRKSDSSFSRKSNDSFSDSKINNIRSSQEETRHNTRAQIHVNNDSKDRSYQIDFYKFHDSMQSNGSKTSKTNANFVNEDKSFNNTSVDEFGKSTKLLHNNNSNYMKISRKYLEKQKQNCILKRQSNRFCSFLGKYKILRSPGCWRPMFLFINRGSCENVETYLRGFIDPRNTYYILNAKYGQVYNELKTNQYVMFYNYSLI